MIQLEKKNKKKKRSYSKIFCEDQEIGKKNI